MTFGPLQILALAFPSTDKLEGRIAAELTKLNDAGIIRVVDVLAVAVEDDEIDIIRGTDLTDAQREELGAEVGALIGLGADGIDGFFAGAEAGAEIADGGGLGIVEAVGAEFVASLPVGSAGLLLIIEHAWAVPLRGAVVDADGMMLANRWIGAQELVMIGAALRAEADAQA